MQFVDEVEIEVRAGDGGNGCVAFRREKFLPLGGPSGGDGGRGGDVVVRVDMGLGTLIDLRYQTVIAAKAGEAGRGRDQYGKHAHDVTVRVPLGTQVFDAASNELLADLDAEESEVVVAKGGRGGRGNIRFATPYDRAPRKAEEGERGERRRLRFELKMLADVGVIGYPNVGKSTFISAVSRARPKIADYPFTTLVPNLGVVSLGDERSFVVADIPGIIEGAAEGAGLGLRFLKHIERTRVLLHLVAPDPDPEREPVRDYTTLLAELERFDADLAKRPVLVAMSKADLPDARDAFPAFRDAMKERGHDALLVSSASREGLEELLQAIERMLAEHPSRPAPRKNPLPILRVSEPRLISVTCSGCTPRPEQSAERPVEGGPRLDILGTEEASHGARANRCIGRLVALGVRRRRRRHSRRLDRLRRRRRRQRRGVRRRRHERRGRLRDRLHGRGRVCVHGQPVGVLANRVHGPRRVRRRSLL